MNCYILAYYDKKVASMRKDWHFLSFSDNDDK